MEFIPQPSIDKAKRSFVSCTFIYYKAVYLRASHVNFSIEFFWQYNPLL